MIIQGIVLVCLMAAIWICAWLFATRTVLKAWPRPWKWYGQRHSRYVSRLILRARRGENAGELIEEYKVTLGRLFPLRYWNAIWNAEWHFICEHEGYNYTPLIFLKR